MQLVSDLSPAPGLGTNEHLLLNKPTCADVQTKQRERVRTNHSFPYRCLPRVNVIFLYFPRNLNSVLIQICHQRAQGWLPSMTSAQTFETGCIFSSEQRFLRLIFKKNIYIYKKKKDAEVGRGKSSALPSYRNVSLLEPKYVHIHTFK